MNFEELKQFSKLMDKHKYPVTPTLENKNSNAYKLFKGLSEGRFENKEEAKEAIFGKDAKDGSFRKLKHELKQKLINTTVLMNPEYENHTELGKEYIECNKLWSTMLIIIQMGDPKFAMEFGHRIYPRIKKSESADLRFLLAYKLKSNFSAIIYNKKKAIYYKKELMIARKRLDAEVLVRDAFTEIKTLMYQKASINKINKAFNHSLMHLDEIEEKDRTIIFQRIYHLLKIRYFELTLNQTALIKECLIAKKLINNQAINYNFDLYLNKHFIVNKEFSRARKIITENSNYVQTHPNSNLELTLFEVLINYHNQNYFPKYLIKKIIELSKKPGTFSDTIEFAKIIIAYNYFLKELFQKDNLKLIFRLNKFLNEVPEATKDKTNGNINLLIIQILVLLVNKKHKAIIEKIESLKQYSYRYLKNDKTLRSNCFIKMLIEMTKVGFNRKRTERHTRKYLEKIQTSKMQVFPLTPVIEIIRFEDLWVMTLELLE